jgi:hypothetical protein
MGMRRLQGVIQVGLLSVALIAAPFASAASTQVTVDLLALPADEHRSARRWAVRAHYARSWVSAILSDGAYDPERASETA